MNKDSIDVCVIYQNWELAERAMRVCSRLGRRLGCDFNVQSDIWNGNALERDDEQERVLQHALRADVIIVAIPADEEPTEGLKSVLDRWAQLRTARPGAVIGFFNTSCPGAATKYVSAVARRARCDFIGPADVSVVKRRVERGRSRATRLRAR